MGKEDMDIEFMDLKTIYFYGDSKEVFMEQLVGFVFELGKGEICFSIKEKSI